MRDKSAIVIGIACILVLSAGPALATAVIQVPEPGTLTLVAVAGAVGSAIGLGRRWRKHREANRRRGDR
jgi:hypothetical protein